MEPVFSTWVLWFLDRSRKCAFEIESFSEISFRGIVLSCGLYIVFLTWNVLKVQKSSDHVIGMIHLWIIILMIAGLSPKWSTHQCEYCIKYRLMRIIIIDILMQIAHFMNLLRTCTMVWWHHEYCYIQLWCAGSWDQSFQNL